MFDPSGEITFLDLVYISFILQNHEILLQKTIHVTFFYRSTYLLLL